MSGTSSSADTRRRRARINKNDASARFTLAVQQTLEGLMQQKGYSRERAAGVILGEICPQQQQQQQRRSVADEEEVYDTMRKYEIGNHQAFTALAVASAIHAKMETRNLTLSESVDEIIGTLTSTKLEDLSEEASISASDALPSSVTPQLQETSVDVTQQTLSTDADNTAVMGATLTPPTSQNSSAGKNSSVNNKKVVAPAKKSKPSSSKGNSKKKDVSHKAARKRSLDEEIIDPLESATSRPRTDSVTEAVSAKLDGCPDGNASKVAVSIAATGSGRPAVNPLVPPPGPNARSKRSRSEDANMTDVKRMRLNSS